MKKYLEVHLSILLMLSLMFTPLMSISVSASEDTSSEIIDICMGVKHNIVLKKDGTVWAWGDNLQGQLGDGTFTESLTPVQVKGLTDVIAISANGHHNMALKKDGTVWVWGAYKIVTGDSEIFDRYISTPFQVPGLTDVTAISAGAWHAMALRKDGTVWVWGSNGRGEYGNGTYRESQTPVQMQGLTDVKAIAAGGHYSIVLENDGTVWGSGTADCGHLGEGAKGFNLKPLQVQGLKSIKLIATGGAATYGLNKDGTIWSLGNNGDGQLGHGTTNFGENKPAQVQGLNDVIFIAPGDSHVLYLKKDGTVWACGNNNVGQLGDGTFDSKTKPVQIKELSDVKWVYASGATSLAMKKDGTIWVWGDRNREFGTGLHETCNKPKQVKWDQIGEENNERPGSFTKQVDDNDTVQTETQQLIISQHIAPEVIQQYDETNNTSNIKNFTPQDDSNENAESSHEEIGKITVNVATDANTDLSNYWSRFEISLTDSNGFEDVRGVSMDSNDMRYGYGNIIDCVYDGVYSVKVVSSEYANVELKSSSIVVRGGNASLDVVVTPRYTIEVGKNGNDYKFSVINIPEIQDKVYSGNNSQIFGVAPGESYMIQDKDTLEVFLVSVTEEVPQDN